MKRTPSQRVLEFLFVGLALAVSSPTAFGQSCSVKPLLQGRVCSKPGARCSPPTLGGGSVGICTTEGLRPEALACECQGAPTPSYNITLTLLTPGVISTGSATSTITVTPFNGFTGKIDFTCAVSGVGHPGPSCATPPSATVTGSSATSLLVVSSSESTGDATFTVTVTAVDAHGQPPDNGAQSATVLVSHSSWIIGNSFGSAKMALVTFLVLLTLWVLGYLWRTRRPASR